MLNLIYSTIWRLQTCAHEVERIKNQQNNKSGGKNPRLVENCIGCTEHKF